MNLFVFGLGYSATAFVRRYRGRFACVAGTVRSLDKAERLRAEGIEVFRFSGDGADEGIADAFARAEAVLISVPPGPQGDPVLARYAEALASAPRLAWAGYLSTVGVYGDHGGAIVDETVPATPKSERSRERLAAENAWLAFGRRAGKAVHVFRLAGIYGPGTNALANLARGTARRVVKPGQVFNRIHVDDIAAALMASIERPRPGGVYNVADDEPAPPQDVIAHAAALLGVPAPPETPFDAAAMSPMAASFYAESKRVSNRLIKQELGWMPLYPSYREGLAALHAAGEGIQAA